MSPQHKLIAGTVAVAVLAGGGAALAAFELSSSSPTAVPTVTATVANGIGSYGFGGGRLGGRGLGGGLGPGVDGGRFADGGPGPGGRALFGSGLTGAASYLGVSASTLRSELASGQTLAQVARAQGKTVEGLIAAMVAAQHKALATAVSNGYLTRAQANQLESSLQARMKDIANGVRPHGPLGNGAPGGGSSGGGSRTFGGGATA